jgi:UDP-glucose 4-epimerase
VHTVLVSAHESNLGGRVAREFERRQVRAIGLPGDIGPADPQFVDMLREARVDTVVHLTLVGEEQPTYHGEETLQRNIINSMVLLGACARAGVRRVVLRSSTLVYGAHMRNPAFITEEHSPRLHSLTGLLREYGEIDMRAAEFASTHPDIEVVRLRCAGLVGDGIWSPLAHYLAQPMPRLLLGFDPRIQVLHPDDAAATFVLAALGNVTGALNIAADDPLALVQAVRLTGKQPLPVPGLLLDGRTPFPSGQRRGISGAWPFPESFLRASCVADTRRAAQELGWTPRYHARDILRSLKARPPAYVEQHISEPGKSVS